MGNNVFQGPFNITSAAINAAVAGATLTPRNVSIDVAGYYAWAGRTAIRSPASGALALRDFSETISVTQLVEANEILAQRNGTNAQIFRFYNTFTDASNYERGSLGWSGNVLTLGSESAGTGGIRDISINAAGTNLAVTQNGITLARNGTSNPSQFISTPTGLTSTAQLVYRFAPSINQASGSYTVLDVNPTETAIGAGPHYLVRGRIGGGGDVFSVENNGRMLTGSQIQVGGSTSSFPMLKRSSATLQARLANDSAFADFGANSLIANSGVLFMGTNGTLQAVADGIFAPKDNAGTSGGVFEFLERADPPAPGANIGRLYVRDNGSGKSQLVVRFPTGAIQVIATEP